jgi:hypothetical protein
MYVYVTLACCKRRLLFGVSSSVVGGLAWNCWHCVCTCHILFLVLCVNLVSKRLEDLCIIAKIAIISIVEN